MANTVVYGGTFNPIHRGHTALIHSVLASGEYHRLLLMPAAMPPHKDAPQLAGAQHRLAMCRLAVQGMAGVQVGDWELRQGGKSYTVATLEYLHTQHPQDSFFLLIGADMFLTFNQWKDWQRIGVLAQLLVASRTGDDIAALERQQQQLLPYGVHAQILHNCVVEVSSTQVREELAQNGCSGGLSPVIQEYCKAHCLYGIKYDLAQLRAVIKPLQKPSRYHHSLCVEQRAVFLAQRYGADENKAAAAGLLHDICKNMPDAALLQMLQSCGTMAASNPCTELDFADPAHAALLHSYAGAVYIQKELGIAEDDLLNAVRYHTTGRAGMSVIEKIIYIADLTSAERDFPDAAPLRELSNHSLDAAMLSSLEFMVEHQLPLLGARACAATTQALAEYRNKQIQEDLQ